MHLYQTPVRALLALTVGLPALLSANTVEERLLQLETRLSAITEENAALREKLGEPSPIPVTIAGKEKSLSIGGYLQLQAEAGDSPDARFPAEDRFLLRRARLTLKGSLVENLDFVFQSEFGSGSLGTNTGNRAQLSDLYVIWNKFDYANVTLGQFKTPYGYEQLMSDTKGLLIERSLPNDRLTLSRQVGAMLSGEIIEDRLNYSAGLFNGNGVNNGGNDNDQFAYVGRLTGTIINNKKFKLTAGANAFQSDDTNPLGFTGDRTGTGLDLQAKAGRFDATAEWLRTKSSPDVGADTTAEGWSVLLGYHLIAKKLQAVVRYETFDPNTDVSGDDSDLWTVGFNYFLKGDDLKLSLNYLLGDPAGPLSDQGRLLARVQVIF
jgi:phosphate-selective porin OprO and OprP